jgi:hypothetical protein
MSLRNGDFSLSRAGMLAKCVARYTAVLPLAFTNDNTEAARPILASKQCHTTSVSELPILNESAASLLIPTAQNSV